LALVAELVDAAIFQIAASQHAGSNPVEGTSNVGAISKGVIMARITIQMQQLTELRDRLMAQISQHQRQMEALQNQLLGVEASIRALSNAPKGSSDRNVKGIVLDLVREAGAVGVTAAEVIGRAAAKGRQLKATSVSSLLSRYKAEGALRFDGERYFITPAAEPFVKLIKPAANGG
jgi:hypothetical protein